MLSLVDRLSNPADAGFMDRTQVEQPVADLMTEQASAGFIVRRAGAADLPALGEFFAGLSARTRYLRFFAPVTPNPALLRLLCGESGGAGGAGGADAVVAVRDGAIIGHAMAADAAPGSQEAPVPDIGIVVDDAWQGRGVGAALMRALIAAVQARGVTTLAMDVLQGNRKVLAMISAHWPATQAEHSRDCVTVHVRLPQPRQRRAPATAGPLRRPGFAVGPAAWSGRVPVSRAASS